MAACGRELRALTEARRQPAIAAERGVWQRFGERVEQATQGAEAANAALGAALDTLGRIILGGA